jgi:probable metal-binding protein
MENIRHIHEVLELLYTSNRTFTTSELASSLQKSFGADVNFVNCADHQFGLGEVVSFLLSKNKIRLEDDLIIPLTPACSH